MKIEQQILEKLDRIEKDVKDIRDHMIDVDTILADDERRLLEESIKHQKDGKLISLEELENVRNKSRQSTYKIS